MSTGPSSAASSPSSSRSQSPVPASALPPAPLLPGTIVPEIVPLEEQPPITFCINDGDQIRFFTVRFKVVQAGGEAFPMETPYLKDEVRQIITNNAMRTVEALKEAIPGEKGLSRLHNVSRITPEGVHLKGAEGKTELFSFEQIAQREEGEGATPSPATMPSTAEKVAGVRTAMQAFQKAVRVTVGRVYQEQFGGRVPEEMYVPPGEPRRGSPPLEGFPPSERPSFTTHGGENIPPVGPAGTPQSSPNRIHTSATDRGLQRSASSPPPQTSATPKPSAIGARSKNIGVRILREEKAPTEASQRVLSGARTPISEVESDVSRAQTPRSNTSTPLPESKTPERSPSSQQISVVAQTKLPGRTPPRARTPGQEPQGKNPGQEPPRARTPQGKNPPGQEPPRARTPQGEN